MQCSQIKAAVSALDAVPQCDDADKANCNAVPNCAWIGPSSELEDGHCAATLGYERQFVDVECAPLRSSVLACGESDLCNNVQAWCENAAACATFDTTLTKYNRCLDEGLQEASTDMQKSMKDAMSKINGLPTPADVQKYISSQCQELYGAQCGDSALCTALQVACYSATDRPGAVLALEGEL